MSTRAQIAIQIGPNQWAQIYVHYDGYPSHMLPALAPWTPEDILAAKEIRQVRADGIEAFERPRDPVILPMVVSLRLSNCALRPVAISQRRTATSQ